MLPRLLPRSLPSRFPTRTPAHSISSSSRACARRPTRSSSKNPRPTRSNPFPSPEDVEPPPDADPGLLDDADPLNLRGSRPEETTVRFFSQDVSEVGSAAPKRVSEARMAADARTAAELWRRITKLEREVDELERDDPLDTTIMRLRAMELDLPDTDVEMLDEANPERVRAEMEALRVAVPEVGGAAVERLNNCLRHAFLATDPKNRPVIRQELWKAYKRAKLHSPDLLPRIPNPAWDILFYSQAVRWKSNPRREKHVSELLADMKSVGMDGPPTRPPGEQAVEDVD